MRFQVEGTPIVQTNSNIGHMKKLFLALSLLVASISLSAQPGNVKILENQEGLKLVVNEKDFFINEINWDYFPSVQPLNGRFFQVASGTKGNYSVYQDKINSEDNWGGKVELTYAGGKFSWYSQASAIGLVANGCADFTKTFTRWRSKDCGCGNKYNFLSGFTYTTGNIQIAPNFIWQNSIEGSIPSDVPAPGRPGSILDDPFAVRFNREMTTGEIMLTYDPTPGSWMYDWDNDRTIDAKLAISAGIVYHHLPTTQDAAFGILPNGRTTFAFPGAAPARDLWEANARIVSKLNTDFGYILNVYGVQGQAYGSNARLV